jgi:hypothetical protein
LRGEQIESFPVPAGLNYRVSSYYTAISFEDVIFEVFGETTFTPNEHEPLKKVDQENPLTALGENLYITAFPDVILLMSASPAEVKDIQANKRASKTEAIHTIEPQPINIPHTPLNKEEPVAELKISQDEASWSFWEKSAEILNRTNPDYEPIFAEKEERSETGKYLPYMNSEQIEQGYDFGNKPAHREAFRVEIETSEKTYGLTHRQTSANSKGIEPERFAVSYPEQGKFLEVTFSTPSQNEASGVREDINSDSEKFAEFSQEKYDSHARTLVHPDKAIENGEDHRKEKGGKSSDLLSFEGHANTVKFQDDRVQQIERVEKPQPQPSYEPKHINIRLEEGSVRFMLSGDRLRLFMNLSEDLYRQPTTFEVHRLVQSLQSLGLNLEVLKLNGNSLYSSDHRQGAKRESREKSHMFFVSEPSENTAKSFSLYL